MKFSTTKMLAVAAFTAVPMLASAQLTANVSVTTNYKFRGQDQDIIGSNGALKTTGLKPALQGGFDYAFANGFYVGNWNSSVNWLQGNSIEMDFYGGYKGEIAKDFGYDVGVLTYQYPGNKTGETTEIYGGLTYGPFSAKYSHTVSKDYFAYGALAGVKGRGTGYINLAYAQEIAKGLTLKASIGKTNLKSGINAAGIPDFIDYSVGVAYDLGNGLSVGAAAVGATKKSSYPEVNDTRLVVSLTKSM